MSERSYLRAKRIALRLLLTAGLLAAATGVGYVFLLVGFPETNVVITYLLAVLLTAWLTSGFLYGIFASVVATFAYNFFFTAPYFTLRVHDPSYLVTFSVMTLTALITSTLTAQTKRSALSARQKEAETKAIYQLTNRLTDAADLHEIAEIAGKAIRECFGGDVVLVSFFEQERPELQLKPEAFDGQTGASGAVPPRCFEWPIRGGEGVLGMVCIPEERAQLMDETQTGLLRSMAESTALAMDRLLTAEQNSRTREAAVQEHFRGNLLRAISHDLRTPLSGIIGTSEMLMDMTERGDPRYSLAEGIFKDAEWLHAMVENILSLTRLQDGKLSLDKQLEAVEEVIDGAVNQIAQRAPGVEITVSAPSELLLVPMDARLIQQVLINLLDNAVKHTPPDGEIAVTAEVDDEEEEAVITVKDSGTGIEEGDLPHIFEMFYTKQVKPADAHQGVGLGLSICDAIVKAHGGTITAKNRSDRSGAEFTFTLPLEVAHGKLS